MDRGDDAGEPGRQFEICPHGHWSGVELPLATPQQQWREHLFDDVGCKHAAQRVDAAGAKREHSHGLHVHERPKLDGTRQQQDHNGHKHLRRSRGRIGRCYGHEPRSVFSNFNHTVIPSFSSHEIQVSGSVNGFGACGVGV